MTEVKNYLRVQTNAEDSVVTDLLASAKAWAETLVGRPITSASRAMTGLTGIRDSYNRSVLYLPVWPAVSAGLTVVDANGDTVAGADYTLDVDAGKLISATGKYFGTPPYTVTATSGLSSGSTYSAVVEPILRSLILGLSSILYHQRNPNALNDSAGGGVSVSYRSDVTGDDLPKNLHSLVGLIRVPRLR